MSMDKSAIEQIQQSQTAESLNSDLTTMDLMVPVLAAPQDYKIHNLEDKLPGRTRYRGTFETRIPESFMNYCADHDVVGAVCFVDPEQMNAKAVLNLGTESNPGHADFTATLNLKHTAEYTALLDHNGKRLDQRRLAEFIEDWQHAVAALDGEGKPMNLSRAIMAIREMSVEGMKKRESEVGDFRGSRSTLETVEAKSKHDLPNSLLFSCVPYNGLKSRDFDLRISVIASDDNPQFTVRIKRLEAIEEEMGKELADLIEDAGADLDMAVTIGTFQR